MKNATDLKTPNSTPLTELHILIRKNKKLLKNYLAPYSIVLTAVIPTLLYVALLSPLYRLFLEKLTGETFSSFEDQYARLQRELASTSLTYFNVVQELSNQKMVFDALNPYLMMGIMFMNDVDILDFAVELISARTDKPHPETMKLPTHNPDWKDFLSVLDSMSTEETAHQAKLSPDPGIRYLTAIHPMGTFNLKYYIIQAITRLKGAVFSSHCSPALLEMFTYSAKNPIIPDGNLIQFEILPKPTLFDKKFIELLSLLEDAQNARMQTTMVLNNDAYSADFRKQAQKHAEKNALYLANKWLFLCTSLMAGLSKVMLFDPLVILLYNRFLNPLSVKELTRPNFAKDIAQQNGMLLSLVKRNVLYARYLSVLCISYFLYCGISNTDISTSIFIFRSYALTDPKNFEFM